MELFPEDFFPEYGIHQGFMPELARRTNWSLALALSYWRAEADKRGFAWGPTPKAGRLALIQDGVETIRSGGGEDWLTRAAEAASRGEEWTGDETLRAFCRNSLFPADGAPRLDVYFEILEWLVTGPAWPRPLAILLEYFLPAGLANWYQEQAAGEGEGGEQAARDREFLFGSGARQSGPPVCLPLAREILKALG